MSEIQEAIEREASGDLTGPVDGPIASRIRERRQTIAEETALSTIDIQFVPNGDGVAPRVTDAAATNVREYLDPDEIALIEDTLSLPSEQGAAADVLSNTPVRVAGEIDTEAAERLASINPESDRSFISRVADRVSLTIYGDGRDEPAEGVPTLEFADQDRLSRFLSALRAADAETVRDALDNRTVDSSLRDRAEDRITRRDVREDAREAAESAGLLGEFGVDARADGTVILSDRDTGRTRTIDPEGDLGDAIDQQTDGGSFEPTSSSSNDTTSNVPSLDDLAGGRLAAAVAIGAAVLYGVTQS